MICNVDMQGRAPIHVGSTKGQDMANGASFKEVLHLGRPLVAGDKDPDG